MQFELKKDIGGGKKSEMVFNVLTCVDLATGFAQQVVVPKGPNNLSKAFHSAWTGSLQLVNGCHAMPRVMVLKMVEVIDACIVKALCLD